MSIVINKEKCDNAVSSVREVLLRWEKIRKHI